MIGRAALIAVLALALAGCATREPEPMPVPSTSTSPSANASAAPDTSAAGRKAQFDETNEATAQSGGGSNPGGRAFIDALVAAGFDRAQMQVTYDKTAISLEADNVQFSVLIGSDCLIGQFGNVGYQSTIQPMLSTGACLIGKTRPIDW
jgi:hypothetical protein